MHHASLQCLWTAGVPRAGLMAHVILWSASALDPPWGGGFGLLELRQRAGTSDIQLTRGTET